MTFGQANTFTVGLLFMMRSAVGLHFVEKSWDLEIFSAPGFLSISGSVLVSVALQSHLWKPIT